MSQQRLRDSLTTLFTTHAVVFWNDVEAEFASAVDGLQLHGVQLVRLDDTPALTPACIRPAENRTNCSRLSPMAGYVSHCRRLCCSNTKNCSRGIKRC